MESEGEKKCSFARLCISFDISQTRKIPGWPVIEFSGSQPLAVGQTKQNAQQFGNTLVVIEISSWETQILAQSYKTFNSLLMRLKPLTLQT